MRVLLVRPPVPRQTMGLKHIMICEPLELEYVAAGLDGHDVEILDLLLERGLERRLRRFRPDIVGVSSYITGVHEVVKICRRVKRWNAGCLTVVGGVHASQAASDFSDPAVDVIVPGDGASIMREIAGARTLGRPMETVPGLALPQPGGDLLRTAPRAYMPDPDTLPFPRRDLVKRLRHRYYYLFHQPVALLKTTWGCWYRCRFCFTWGITGGTPYVRSPESIAGELATIEEEEVYIVDDIFLINPGRLNRLADLLRRRGIRKNYLAYARADFVAAHESIIAEWADLGLRAVFLGLEATTDPELGAMNKETTVDMNRTAVAILRRHGIDTYASLITGPDYLPEDWERLWRFIEECGLYYVNISPLTPLPGAPAWADLGTALTVPRAAYPLFDLSHVLLPTRMALRDYYRSLLRLYMKTCLNPRRASRLALRTRPPVWSRRYFRLWAGAFRIWLQLRSAHRHHAASELARAASREVA